MTDEELREALARRVQSARLSEPERSDILRAARLRTTAPGSRSLWTPAAGWLAAAAGALVLALVMAPILLSPPGSATDAPAVSPSPDPSGRVTDPVIFNVQNGTTLTIEVHLNDVRVATVEPGTTAEIDPSPLSDAPWHVEARTTGGRVLVALDAQPGDVWRTQLEDSVEIHGVGGRADLSCGRLDVWAGPPLGGPAPPETFPPGDCDVGTPAPVETESTPLDCMTALITGRLAYDAATGFSLIDPDDVRVRITWPDGFGAAQIDDRYAVVDASGTALAFEGDLIELGGGFWADGSWLTCGFLTIIEPAPSPQPSQGPPQGPLDFDDLAGLTWSTALEPFDGPLGTQVDGIFGREDGAYVAWGLDQEEADGGYAMVSFWISNDGVSWRETKLEGYGDFVRVYDVAQGPRGIVAIGGLEDRPTIWWSADAETWQRGTVAPGIPSESANVRAVAANDSGFVLVGTARGRAAAWHSPDGLDWSPVGPKFPEGWLNDVTSGPDGSFTVVGVNLERKHWDAAIWRVSTEGSDWTPAAPNDALSGPDDEEVARVWHHAGGFLATGDLGDAEFRLSCVGECFPDTRPRLWVSTDGLVWTAYDSPDEPVPWTPTKSSAGNPRLREMSAIEPWRDGLLAVGAGTDFGIRAWFSTDGLTWDPLTDPILVAGEETPPDYQADTVQGLVILDDRLLIGGWRTAAGEDGYVMIGELSR